MGPSYLFSLAAVISPILPLASAQTTLISNTLPACAQSCPVLLQAQSACVPPPTGAAAVSNQQTYTSCFCQSNYLVPLKSGSANNLCPTCSAADLSTTQQWYNGLCQQGTAPANNNNGNNNNGQQPAKSSSTLTTSTTTPPASKQTGSNTAGGVTQDTSPEDQNKSWISTHYRWIIMIIVLFFGFLALALGGRYLHRRYQRRDELGGHSRTGQPDLGSWVPGQSVHDFAPPSAAGAVAENEKGKQSVGVQEEQQQQQQQQPPAAAENKRSSRRLKKIWI